ncbi:unnamed protein product [Prunus armeniaca]|uniref:Retrotransposon Copia-like N-terminal domain-containing protein n=1 Tax=Prunus armeniaca TaxID=36596 RepID=A0A6J5TGU0_PRUAR|nr:unnamed protein product [Prunus armeniaca]
MSTPTSDSNPFSSLLEASLHMTIQQEVSSSPINVKLDGINYPLWPTVLEMHIEARKKYGYIFGAKIEHKAFDPKFEELVAENALVKSWLINFMYTNMMLNFIQCRTTKDVWDTVKKMASLYRRLNDLENPYDIAKLKRCTSEECVCLLLAIHNLDQFCSRVFPLFPSLLRKEAQPQATAAAKGNFEASALVEKKRPPQLTLLR